MSGGIRNIFSHWTVLVLGAMATVPSSSVYGYGVCDPEFEICFQGVGDLPGGLNYSEAFGIAFVNGTVVVVGESSSEQSHHPLNCFGCNEAFKFSGGVIRRIFNLPAQARSKAADVALIGSTTIVTGTASGFGAMRAVQSGDSIVTPMTFPQPPGGAGLASGNSISDDGLAAVGDLTVPAASGAAAFRWTESGGTTVLPILNPNAFKATLRLNGTSPSGFFSVGGSSAQTGYEGYIFPGPSQVVCIPSPCPPIGMGDLSGGNLFSEANAVTDSGVAAGFGTTSAGQEAFRWTPASQIPSRPAQMLSLGDLPGGAVFSEAYGISNNGQVVVGLATSAVGQEAFLWHPNLGIRNLRELMVEDYGATGLTGWTLFVANAISTNGLAIAGKGRNPSMDTEGWFLTLPDCNGNTTWDGLEAPAPFTLTSRPVLSIDGLNSYLEMASPPSLQIAGALTIEAWVYLNRLSAIQAILVSGSAGESLSTNVLYSIEVDTDGDIRVMHERSDFSNAVATFDTNLHTGLWHHLAVTRNIVSGTNVEYSLFVNDRAPITIGVSGLPIGGTSGRLQIGHGEGVTFPPGFPSSFDRPFDGFFADVRIWNVVRSADEIRDSKQVSMPVNTSGLVALWPMDETSGSQVLDAVASNHFTITGGGARITVGADCNQNRIPDTCEEDCNGNSVPDDCDIRLGTSQDCDVNAVPDECDTSTILEQLFSADHASAEFFRQGRATPMSAVTFGTMIENYGRPWKPGTGQTPGGGICAGGSENGEVCAVPLDCPGGQCQPPGGPGDTRDPAEKLRMLAMNRTCIAVGIAQKVFEELFAFEMLLGNEAFADALDPTVGEGTLGDPVSLEQVPGLFAFRGLPSVPSLLEEELALLAGRVINVPSSASVPLNDEPATNINGNYPQFDAATRAAIYNRLRPNAVAGLGSLAYRANYGFSDTPTNGAASLVFPQGHGDAYGYYLKAEKVYLDAFGADVVTPGAADFALAMIQSQSPMPGVDCTATDCEMIEDDDGTMHEVGFQSVRNMAAAMAARARTANRLVDLTFRRDYRENADMELLDTDRVRARGTTDWARRGGLGAYLDWAVLNQLLPVPDENAPPALEAVHRKSVDEIRALASAADEMQDRVDAAGGGLNPLGLVPNVVPFRIIQPGQLLNFLEGGASAGKSHYGIVRDAALEAIRNARGILKRANVALNRLRGNEEAFTDFENQVRDSDTALTNRLIEVFGLPSLSDTSDNDFEDNDGDGIQVVGVLNDPDDDILEAGCGGECPGSPDLRNFMIDSEAATQLGLQERLAVGEIQLAMFALRSSGIKIQTAEAELARLEALIEAKANNLALTKNEQVEALEINAQACGERMKIIDRKFQMAQARQERGWLSSIGGLIASGVSCYFTGACGDTIGKALSFFGDAFGGFNSRIQEIRDEFDLQREELRINCWQTAELTAISNDQTIRNLEIELEDHMRQTPQAILNLALAQNEALQALAVVNKGIQEGKRLVDDRARVRRVQTDKLQNFRFKDMAFRTFRNQSLEQYGAFFDLAGRYVMLAARAFAYEYNERDEVDAQMRNLHRERLLGTESAADQGLESIIVRLDQKRQESDFVSRLQKLSLFDHGGDEFSLRKNALGLAINASEDTDAQQREKNKAFRAFLESQIVQDLLDVSSFRQLASFDSDRDAGPALVLTFGTEVAGRTFFGKRRGTIFGAPANFDTCSNPKMFEFAILLEGVDNPNALGVDSQLIFAHFIPVGASMVREPLAGNCSLRPVRSWAVVDQRIPGVSAAYRDNGSAVLDSFDIPRLATSPELNILNRFPVTQAQIRLTENPVFQDDLAGWSVWNTQWLLAIPGRQFTDPGDDAAVVRQKLMILIYDANQNGLPRNPDENLGIDDIKLRLKAYGKPS